MPPTHEVSPVLDMDLEFAIKELARLIVDIRVRELGQTPVVSVAKSLKSPTSPNSLVSKNDNENIADGAA